MSYEFKVISYKFLPQRAQSFYHKGHKGNNKIFNDLKSLCTLWKLCVLCG